MKTLLLIAVLLSSATLTLAQTTPETKNAVYGEVACGNMYHLMDVGAQAHGDATCKAWINYDRKIDSKTTISFGVWGQVAAHEASPNGAEEFDYTVTLSHQRTKHTSMSGYFGNYSINGYNVRKYSGTISYSFTAGKMPITVSNETMYFSTSKPKDLPGGFANKLSLSTSRYLGKGFTASGSIAVSGDDGPFGLQGPAMIGFATGRLEKKLTDHLSLFVNGRYSQPWAGETVRRRLFSFDTGMAFRWGF